MAAFPICHVFFFSDGGEVAHKVCWKKTGIRKDLSLLFKPEFLFFYVIL